MTPPLGRFRLLDLSRQLPGPFCSTLLADLGMDVLSITAPGDPFLLGIPSLARNKRSMTLDLKDPRGREVFLRLADRADVVLEGFRPGVTARLGVDHATLAARNPRLVYCAISGFGQDGPYRDKVGHDVNYLGWAGVLEYMGRDGEPPVVPGVQIADVGGGSLMAAVGILAALMAREQTGRGQMVDVSLLDGALAWNVYHQLLYAMRGTPPARGREQLTGHHACYNVYETADGRWLTLGAYELHFWAALCRHLGREDLIAEQWSEDPVRSELIGWLRVTFRAKPLAAWLEELAPLDVCVGPVNGLEEAYRDPQVRHRGLVVEQQTASGPLRMIGPPIKLSDTPASVRTPPPGLGEHTDAVLAALGYDAATVAALHEAGVV